MKGIRIWILRYWLPVLTLMGFIAFFSLVPKPSLPIDLGGFEKGIIVSADFTHVLVYFFLSYLLGVAFEHTKGYNKNSYILGFLLAISFGGILELLQGSISGRHLSLLDEIYNILGSGLAQMLRFFINKK